MPEQQWIEEAQAGSEAAVELLIRCTYDDVYRFVRWKVHHDELAWDLTKMTYEKAWAKLATYHSGKGSFRSWLVSIANHLCIDPEPAPARKSLRTPPHVPTLERQPTGRLFRLQPLQPSCPLHVDHPNSNHRHRPNPPQTNPHRLLPQIKNIKPHPKP